MISNFYRFGPDGTVETTVLYWNGGKIPALMGQRGWILAGHYSDDEDEHASDDRLSIERWMKLVPLTVTIPYFGSQPDEGVVEEIRGLIESIVRSGGWIPRDLYGVAIENVQLLGLDTLARLRGYDGATKPTPAEVDEIWGNQPRGEVVWKARVQRDSLPDEGRIDPWHDGDLAFAISAVVMALWNTKGPIQDFVARLDWGLGLEQGITIFPLER